MGRFLSVNKVSVFDESFVYDRPCAFGAGLGVGQSNGCVRRSRVFLDKCERFIIRHRAVSCIAMPGFPRA
eukprot:3539871-Lingulodinium_polyedra.AAC.1